MSLQTIIDETEKEFRKKYLYTVQPTEIAPPMSKSITYWNKDVEDASEALIFLHSSQLRLLQEVKKRCIYLEENYKKNYSDAEFRANFVSDLLLELEVK